MSPSWFRPKSYGWRFTPVSWQGWISALLMLLLIFSSAYGVKLIVSFPKDTARNANLRGDDYAPILANRATDPTLNAVIEPPRSWTIGDKWQRYRSTLYNSLTVYLPITQEYVSLQTINLLTQDRRPNIHPDGQSIRAATRYANEAGFESALSTWMIQPVVAASRTASTPTPTPSPNTQITLASLNCNVDVGPGQTHSTIQAGINAATANQTVCVHYDTYHEAININKPGLTLLGISNADNQKPIIDGQYTLPTGSQVPGYGQYYDGYGRAESRVYEGLVRIQANDVTLDNLFLTRSHGRGISADRINGTVVNQVDILGARGNGISFLRCQHTTIQNSSIKQAVNAAPWPHDSTLMNWGAAFQSRGSEYMLIDGLVVSETWGEGINPLHTKKLIVRNNVSYDNWRVNIYLDNVHDAIIENNLSYHTENSGIPKSGGLTVKVENPFGNVGGADTGAEGTQNIIIRNNLLIHNSTGLSFGKQNLQYNLTNIWVYNNTIVDPDGRTLVAGRLDVNDTGFIKNNIFVGGQTNTPPGFEITNNLFYEAPAIGSHSQTADPRFINRNVPITAGLTQMPEFKLQQGSPAINQSVVIPDPDWVAVLENYQKQSRLTKDHFDCPRDSQPDIGAAEYTTNCHFNPDPASLWKTFLSAYPVNNLLTFLTQLITGQ